MKSLYPRRRIVQRAIFLLAFVGLAASLDSENVASHTRYTHFNLTDLLGDPDKLTSTP